MKKIILLLFIVLSACTAQKQTANFAAGDSSQQSSIINGTPVPAENPYAKSVVGLLFHYKMSDLGEKVWFMGCTGTILNDRFVLTASHCLQDADPADLAINFSVDSLSMEKQQDPTTRINDIEKKFVIRKVKALMTHPQFFGSGNHDVAVIQLAEPIPAGHVAVTFLPDANLDLAKNRTSMDGKTSSITLVGFGLVKESPRESSDVLRMTTLNARFENQFVITDQTHGTGGCNGDSGGPAFYDMDGKTYQVGVTHGPHAGSTNCGKEGEWVNPGLEKQFIADAQKKMSETP